MDMGRLCSIPEPPRRENARGGLVTTECEEATSKSEVTMKGLNAWLVRFARTHSLLIVLLLSVVHVLVAAAHARDSGTADLGAQCRAVGIR